LPYLYKEISALAVVGTNARAGTILYKTERNASDLTTYIASAHNLLLVLL
jgi:hypothetical protein